MINKKIFNELLQKDMSRKQFLQMAGAAVLSVIGFTAFLKNLEKFAGHHSGKKVERGYGSSSYGR
jgi:predicted tellurium resistance membrane protein TerC